MGRVAAGKTEQTDMQKEQRFLGKYENEYVVCSNREENDEHWDSAEPEWLGKASMSKRHRFLTLKSLHWQWFNPICFGLVSKQDGGVDLDVAIARVEQMKAAAVHYTSSIGGWSAKIGLFFHVFGHNTVNSCHLHILDLNVVGPSFWNLEYKNCSLDAVLKVLNEERHSLPPRALTEATEAAARAADAAAELALSVVQKFNSDGLLRTKSLALDPEEIVNLTVGGELICIPRSTLLLTPEESTLHEMFSPRWNGKHRVREDNGRVFLNYPPTAFKAIMNHLRLLHLTPSDNFLDPPRVPAAQRQDFEDLAYLLGLDEFLFGGPLRGKAKQDAIPPLRSKPRAVWMCGRRFRY